MKKLAFIALLAATAYTPASAITVINFDDLTGSGTVADGYQGVKWDNNFTFYDESEDPYNPSSPRTRVFANYDLHPIGDPGSRAF